MKQVLQVTRVAVAGLCLRTAVSLVQAQTPNASVPNTPHEESAIGPAADTVRVASPTGEKETLSGGEMPVGCVSFELEGGRTGSVRGRCAGACR